MLDAFHFTDQLPSKVQAREWAEQIRREYLDHHNSTDTAAKQMIGALTVTFGHFQMILCLNQDQPIGMLTFREEAGPERIELYSLAVLPSYQRRGIGSALLEKVKDVGRGRLPIFTSGVKDESLVVLRRAGFWPGKDRGNGNFAFKWSDLADHQNDDTPGAEEE